jgi:hypothetical protein
LKLFKNIIKPSPKHFNLHFKIAVVRFLIRSNQQKRLPKFPVTDGVSSFQYLPVNEGIFYINQEDSQYIYTLNRYRILIPNVLDRYRLTYVVYGDVCDALYKVCRAQGAEFIFRAACFCLSAS